MKVLTQDFRVENGWFAGNTGTDGGPLQIAYKQGSGGANSKGLHYHRSTYEYWIVVGGSAILHLEDGKMEVLTAGVIVMIAPTDRHNLTDKSEDFKVFMIVDKYVPNDTIGT
jgi:mannose-6-phosphate isomerase-like protein (cupin superfamily)